MLFFVHIFSPHARHHTSKFFQISYYNPKTGTYALGWDDIFFVFYWIIVFTGARCATMDYLLTPVAAWAGLSKKKMKMRFAEQTWIILYYGTFWGTGMYIMYTSDYWLNLRALWKDWPTREMDGLAKWYYLVQFAFWLQQIAVVNIEERRKDHWQMFTHHIITCLLIFTSYGLPSEQSRHPHPLPHGHRRPCLCGREDSEVSRTSNCMRHRLRSFHGPAGSCSDIFFT